MKHALITGASKGIGFEMAKLLAVKKYNLLLVARNSTELKQAATQLEDNFSISVNIFACDLSEPHAAKRVFEWYKSLNVWVEVLINNAGFGAWGYFHQLSWDEQHKMLQTNLMALTEMCYLFVPELARNAKSYILNVSSSTAYQAVPTMAAYAAGKSYVLQFSRALAIELKPQNIYVTCLSPGATATNFVNRAQMNAIKSVADKVSMPADVVAKIGLNGLFNGKTEVIPGFINQLQYFLTLIMPKKWIEKAAGNLYIKYLH